MKLSKKAIKKIDKKAVLKLALALGFTEIWVGRLIKKNKLNGPLTTPSALAVIREATGLEDSDLLEEDKIPAPTK